MKYLTILNHGTSNSTKNTDLVISKLGDIMGGVEDSDWMLNEGAGTGRLFKRDDINKGYRGKTHNAARTVSGIVAGDGVEQNVDRAVQFVAAELANDTVTVNLAGHSRGSITCYKIARALRTFPLTANVPVNIFAIDPVPGNMGTLNSANYKNLALGGNLVNTVLMLAESEHRLAFRPYVDALYSMGLPDHKLDTIPGTHGGINELAGSEKEAAHLVMSRAVEFLEANGTNFLPWYDMWKLSTAAKLEWYAKLMRKIKKYQRHATQWNPGNFITGGAQVDRHRTAVVHGDKTTWGTGNPAILGGAEAGADLRTRADHHGLRLNEALRRGQALGGETVHSTRPNRFFANLEHQELFIQTYGAMSNEFVQMERGVTPTQLAVIQNALPAVWRTEIVKMSQPERDYYSRWLGKRGCEVTNY